MSLDPEKSWPFRSEPIITPLQMLAKCYEGSETTFARVIRAEAAQERAQLVDKEPAL